MKGWTQLTYELTQTPEHEAMLEEAAQRGGNLGILDGPASGVVDIDVDLDSEVDVFLAFNPRFAETMRTRGAAGCHFWFRPIGEYPVCRVCAKKKIVGHHKSVAEFRGGGGHQTVIWGVHPGELPYCWLKAAPPIEIRFEEIVWPPDWGMDFGNGTELVSSVPCAQPAFADPIELGSIEAESLTHIALVCKNWAPAISGNSGHATTLALAVRLASIYPELSQKQLLACLLRFYNPQCRPAWSSTELGHKAGDAIELAAQECKKQAQREAAQTYNDKQREARQEVQPQTRTEQPQEVESAPIFVEFLKPSQIRAYNPPPNLVLVGDNHIVRGNVFVLGGPPGVGKSRGLTALAVGGATGADWFALAVYFRFKTLVIQSENGRYRLQREFNEIDEPRLEDYLRISPPPPYGMCFWRGEFRDQLKRYLDDYGPELIAMDPWNAIARDDRAKDYIETFDIIRSVIPGGDDSPAIGILAHTRKPQPGERAVGRALLNLLAGSYVLGSIPRTVWIMQHASDDVEETRVVLTCCKNNDGDLGKRSAWIRRNGLFVACSSFDWDAWDKPQEPGKNKRDEPPLDEAALAEIFENGQKTLKRVDAVEALMKLTGRSRASCYNALDERKGPLKKWLRMRRGELVFVP
jgi:hypothetical protein